MGCQFWLNRELLVLLNCTGNSYAITILFSQKGIIPGWHQLGRSLKVTFEATKSVPGLVYWAEEEAQRQADASRARSRLFFTCFSVEITLKLSIVWDQDNLPHLSSKFCISLRHLNFIFLFQCFVLCILLSQLTVPSCLSFSHSLSSMIT